MREEIKNIQASLWISASAGTGKTKSLIDRILALLLQNVEPHKILCLTYTKAAASEMLTRLEVYVRKFHFMSDEALESELAALGFGKEHTKIAKCLYEKSLTLRWVQIKTIHSFCLDILKQFPIESGLLSSVTICADKDLEKITNEAYNKIFKDEFLLKADDLGELSRRCDCLKNLTHTGKTVEAIQKNLNLLKTFFAKHGDFDALYSEIFDVDPKFFSLSSEEVVQILMPEFFGENYAETFKSVAEKLDSEKKTDKDNAALLFEHIERPSICFINVFFTDKGEMRKKFCTKDLQKKLPFIVDELEELYQKTLLFLEKYKRIIAYKVNVAFFELAKEILESIEDSKRQLHCIDYDDVIKFSLNLLENIDWVMYKIDSQLEHVLVDEAQDTSPMQWEVIKKLTDEFFANYESEKTIFVVGDEKQSIFSFQGADVFSFKEMRNYLKKRSTESGQQFFDISLNKSYRTTGNILSFVDDIFSETFATTHIPNRDAKAGVVEIIDLFEDDEQESSESWSLQANSEQIVSARQKIAEYIANFIHETIDRHVFVPSRDRAACPEDFFILFKKRDLALVNQIRSLLKKFAIPAAEIDKIEFTKELIIQDLLAIASFALLPLDDLACARVLKTPLFDFSEEDLFEACVGRADSSLYDYILSEPRYLKYNLSLLSDLIQNVYSMSAYNFFMSLLAGERQEKFIERLGPQILDVIEEFLNLVNNFEQNSIPSVANFLDWFHSTSQEKKRTFLENDKVRFSTVHSSKGLQAPFVILADATSWDSKLTEMILKDTDDILFYNTSSGISPEKILNLKKEYKKRNLDEYYRLLYVALTRAEDFVYIIGSRGMRKEDAKTGVRLPVNPPKDCWYSFIDENVKNSNFVKATFNETISLKRIGAYDYDNSEIKAPLVPEPFVMPPWFFEKIPDSENKISEVEIEDNEQITFGNYVHLLFSELPKHRSQKFQSLADDFASAFPLTDEAVTLAQGEIFRILRNPDFSFIFDERSQAEVAFYFEGKEGRIDRIAYKGDEMWIIDFKTGEPQRSVPRKYIEQLKFYRRAASFCMNVSRIQTAILWTKSAGLVLVP